MTSRPDVLAYYFPHWHNDPRDSAWFGPGWSEWELVKKATPRFSTHRQPRVPALGYSDESDPATMAAESALAWKHGLDGFIYDFYWYEDGPYLQRALDVGFLAADVAEGFSFSLMWANHDLVDLYPLTSPPEEVPPRLLRKGEVSRVAFDRMATTVVSRYFSRDNYYRVDGKPFFSVYELATLIAGLGGVDETLDALSDFEAKAVRAGHPGIHFDAVVWGVGVLPGSRGLADPSTMVGRLPFATASSYTWCHHVDLLAQPFPLGDWDEVRRRTYSQYEQYPRLLGLPFIPNISVGWDCSPRTSAALSWEPRKGYGWTPVFECAVGTIKSAARDARSILRAQVATGAPQIVTVNAWNEWTEGSYLMPDSDRGLELLATLSECFPR